MALFFEWDSVKAKTNKEKHKVAFEEAATVFGDKNSLTINDIAHSENEKRENLYREVHVRPDFGSGAYNKR